MMAAEAQISEQLVASQVGEIAIRRYGNGTEVFPVLCLHGWLDNLESFTALGRVLFEKMRENIALVAMDFPGHGYSAWRPEKVAYHFIDGVADAMALVDCLGWQQFHVIGHSMGAAIGALMAASFPERVRSLVSIEALGPLVSAEESGPKRLAEHVQQRFKQPRSPRVFTSIEEAVRLRADKAGPADALVEPLVRRNLRKITEGWLWRTDPRLRWRTPVRMTEPQVQAFLQQIVAPVAVIKAEDGLARTGADIERRLDCLVAGTLYTVPGGHHCHMEYPSLVGQIIFDWWQVHFPEVASRK